MEQFLQDVFNKAKKESRESSLRKWAEYIADYLSDEAKYPLSVKTLERYYNGDTLPNMEKKNKLAMFLGYKDYKDYLRANGESGLKNDEEESISLKKLNFNQENYIVVVACVLFILILVAGYIGYTTGTVDCMIWKEDHYEVTNCEGKPGETEKVPYLIENFRQINVSDTTTFFRNGKPVVWYDKQNNELYFFSAPGINPETGKTLKEISHYMIEKYIKRN
jgi:hypothetical protein